MTQDNQPEAVSDVMTAQDVCALLGIGAGALKRLCREKRFPFTRVGVNRVFLESEIVKWMKTNQEPRQHGTPE